MIGVGRHTCICSGLIPLEVQRIEILLNCSGAAPLTASSSSTRSAAESDRWGWCTPQDWIWGYGGDKPPGGGGGGSPQPPKCDPGSLARDTDCGFGSNWGTFTAPGLVDTSAPPLSNEEVDCESCLGGCLVIHLNEIGKCFSSNKLHGCIAGSEHDYDYCVASCLRPCQTNALGF